MFYKSYTGKTAFPPQETINGKFSTAGTDIIFTDVIDSLSVGDYIYSNSLNEVRKLISFNNQPGGIQGQIRMTLESEFSSNVTNEDVKIVEPIYNNAYLTNFGGANGKLNGEDMPLQSVLNIKENAIVFTIDATGTNISILAVE